ncbi:hypothetical protein NKR23_g5883 [Pleurostoma richardsiae]|uniref:Uncharacterized protein n=1 Tax=Pleurostoma richardsiae TaxID=41990 RepID=A0AA38RML5_9PEZI|nr:hypothetical protein NKR23_g5883 [Pleurostoma richardsiae]
MASQSTLTALFAVTQNVSDVEAQVEFYQDFGFVLDTGYDAAEDVPEEYYLARGVQKSDLVKSTAMRLPADPYMHVIVNSWKNLKRGPAWPGTFDQIGSRGFSLLVADVAVEVARIKRDYPHVRVLHDPITINRGWGKTTSALLLDPEQVFLELITIDKGSPYDPVNVRAPPFGEKQWLHFMLNCSKFEETVQFYKSFGFEHDVGVDFRPKAGFEPKGFAYFVKQMDDAFGYKMGNGTGVAFLRTESDISGMHLELTGHKPGSLKDPDDKPTWPQKGIARFCYRVDDYAACLAHQVARGSKIYVDDQRGCLEWGDTQWCFTGDTDGNIMTQEQWFPCRYWGEKD